MATVGTFNVALIASTGRFTAAISRAERRWNSFAKSVQRNSKMLPKSISSVTPAALTMAKHVAKAAAVAGAALTALGGVGIKLAMDFEQSRIAFTTLLGDAQKADRFLRELEIRARRTPFGFSGLQESARQLLAYGFTADKVLSMIEPIGDAVAAMGGGQEMLERIIRALGQMQAKQKVSAEEMLQLTETGINAWKFLAEGIGTSIPEAMERARKGMIPSAVAIEAILDGMRRRFGGAMKAQANTMRGMLEQIKDSMATISRGFGEDIIRITGMAGAMRRLNEAVGRFADLVSMKGFIGALKEAFPPWLQGVIISIAGAIGGALVPVIIAMLIPALKKLAISLWATLAPLWPWMVAGAALALIIWLLIQYWDQLSYVARRIWPGISAIVLYASSLIVRAVGGIITALAWIIPSFRDTAQAVIEYADSLRSAAQKAFEAARATTQAAQGAQNIANTGQQAAQAQQGLGDALQKTAEKAQDNLQSFDEVHQIQDEMADTSFDFPEITMPEIPALPGLSFGGGLDAGINELEERLSGLAGIISRAFELVKQAMTPVHQVVGWIGEGLDKLGDLAQKAAQVISQYWASAVDAIASAWGRIAGVASQWVNQVASAIDQGWTAIAKATDRVWFGITSGLAAAWNGIIQTANAVWGNITAGIDSAWSTIAAGTQTTWTTISGWLSSAWEGIHNTSTVVWGGIKAFFVQWWDELLAAFSGPLGIAVYMVAHNWDTMTTSTQESWTALKDWLLTTWESLSTAATDVWNAISDIVGAGWEIIRVATTGAWDGILSWLSNTWNGISMAASITWQDLTSVIRTAWNSVNTITQAIWETIRGWLSSAWNNIASTASVIWNGIAQGIGAAWDGIATATQTAWNAIRGWLSSTWNGLKSIAGAVWDGITEVVGIAWEGLANGTRQAWDGLSKWLSSAWQDIMKTADKLWSGLAKTLDAVWDGITKTAKSTWDGVAKWLSNTWKNITNVAEDTWNQIPKSLQKAADSVVKSAKSMATDIGNAVRGMKDKVVSFVKAMVDDVIKWFSSLSTRALDAVKNWTQGVINKIRDMYMQVVGGSIVPDTVNQTLNWFKTLQVQGTAIVGQLGAGITNIFITAFASIVDKTVSFGDAVTGLMQQISFGMQNVFMEAFNGIINGTMTLGEAFRYILSGMGQVVQNVLVQQLAQAASQSLIKFGQWALGVLAKVGSVIVAVIQQAYATLVAFFAWSGPLAPVLAGGVIAAAIAGIGALASQVLNAIGLAQGGIVTGPTFAMLGEGGRREAVIPLERDNVIADSVGQAVYEAMLTAIRVGQASSQPSSGDREIVLRIDGTTFARAILPSIIREGQRQGLQLVVRPQGV